MNTIVQTIGIATIFFVIGQIFLKYTFKNTPMKPLCACGFFCVSMGLIGIVMLLYCSYEKQLVKLDNTNHWFPILAGVVFALGNYFWITSIYSKESLGIIRVVMAGFETFLLFLVGYLLFKDQIEIQKIIGTIIILFGIWLIGK